MSKVLIHNNLLDYDLLKEDCEEIVKVSSLSDGKLKFRFTFFIFNIAITCFTPGFIPQYFYYYWHSWVSNLIHWWDIISIFRNAFIYSFTIGLISVRDGDISLPTFATLQTSLYLYIIGYHGNQVSMLCSSLATVRCYGRQQWRYQLYLTLSVNRHSVSWHLHLY